MPPPTRPGTPSYADFDWSQWYVEADHVAESCEQGAIIEELRSSLRELARRRGWTRCFVGGDNYFAWVPGEPKVRVSPDVYLLDDPPPPPLPKSWQTWRPDHPAPRWAVEIVSDDWQKDYRDNPPKYAQLGCAELVLFDPDFAVCGAGGRKAAERAAITVLRRRASGALEVVYSGQGPAYSQELDAWLVARREGYIARLRIALDESGTQLVPTLEEAARQRADAEEQRAEAAKRTAAAAKRTAAAAKRTAAAAKRTAAAAKRTAAAAKRRAAAAKRSEQAARLHAERAEARQRQLEERLRQAERDPGDEPG